MHESSAHKPERVSNMTVPPEIKKQKGLSVKKKVFSELRWHGNLSNVHTACGNLVNMCGWMHLGKTLLTGPSVALCYNQGLFAPCRYPMW